MLEVNRSFVGAGPAYKQSYGSNDRVVSQNVSSRASSPELFVQLPSTAMDFKVATAQFAMHLPSEDRNRLFSELDYLLNAEGWDEEDSVPPIAPYTNFLRWLIATRRMDWSSLGFDADGNLLGAFVGEKGTVTAAFFAAPIVHWTAGFTTEDGEEISAGQSPLRSFVTTSADLLARIDGE